MDDDLIRDVDSARVVTNDAGGFGPKEKALTVANRRKSGGADDFMVDC
jgi:hypothetical protein